MEMPKQHFCYFVTVTNVLTDVQKKSEYYDFISDQCIGYILSSDIYRVARAISTSGLGGHIIISGCRSSVCRCNHLGVLSFNSSRSKIPDLQIVTGVFRMLAIKRSGAIFGQPCGTTFGSTIPLVNFQAISVMSNVVQ